VSITNPVDWSFWSQRVIPLLGIPDVVMRDHRKISFFDVTETDPSKGEAIFTGMGVGDHYAGPTWEDRAMLVNGPALIDLKDAARQMLLNQGFTPEQIPYPLQPQPIPHDYAELVEKRVEEGSRYRSMQIHNQTGYGPKPINVAKATLYNAMPADSVVIVPDSLWNSPFWAGMLAGNALRGGHVFMISPALDNAPSAGFPQMSRAQEIFAQMIVLQQMMGSAIEDVGGALHTGIYAADVDVGDLAGRTTLYYDSLPTSPLTPSWLGFKKEENPEGWQESLENLKARKAAILNQLSELGFEPGYVVDDHEKRKPKLHLKAQLLLNREAVDVLNQIDWPEYHQHYLLQRAQQLSGTKYADIRKTWLTDSVFWDEQRRLVLAVTSDELRAKAAGYLMVGSHNMDYRGMMMDGEVLYLTAGGGVLAGARDLLLIAGISTWVTTLEQLEELVPAYSEWQRRIGRFIKYAL